MRRSGPPWGEPLLRAYGPVGGARRVSSSPRSRVWRVRLSAGPAVVKQVVGDGAAARFARELTALALAAVAAPHTVPQLLGSDDADLVLVLRDVGSTRPGPEWPVHWATALAGLHLAGRAAVPAADLFADPAADPAVLPRASGPGEADVRAFLRFAAAVGVAVDGAVAGELDAVVERLAAATAAGRALLHGDPCPDNALTTPSGTVFVDLEAACLGDPLVELAYLRLGFPTCWSFEALPADTVARAEAAYRQAWSAGSRLDSDSVGGSGSGSVSGSGSGVGSAVGGDLADVCVGWVLRGDALVERAQRDGTDHLARAAVKDWRWGTATARQRLAHRLGVVADLAADRPDLAATRALAARLHSRLA